MYNERTPDGIRCITDLAASSNNARNSRQYIPAAVTNDKLHTQKKTGPTDDDGVSGERLTYRHNTAIRMDQPDNRTADDLRPRFGCLPCRQLTKAETRLRWRFIPFRSRFHGSSLIHCHSSPERAHRMSLSDRRRRRGIAPPMASKRI